MTVAIAMERYVAVHYPLDYNQVGSYDLKLEVPSESRFNKESFFLLTQFRGSQGQILD